MANNFSAQPPAGRPLPDNWRAMAPGRAQQANSDYQHKLENNWRGNRDNEVLIQSARLTGHPQPAPPAPPRSDSRSDARFDAKMTLVSDNEDEQIWRDFNGATVVIKKRK